MLENAATRSPCLPKLPKHLQQLKSADTRALCRLQCSGTPSDRYKSDEPTYTAHRPNAKYPQSSASSKQRSSTPLPTYTHKHDPHLLPSRAIAVGRACRTSRKHHPRPVASMPQRNLALVLRINTLNSSLLLFHFVTRRFRRTESSERGQ